jgi:hypothetical protein
MMSICVLSKTKSFQSGLFARVIKAARIPALALCSVVALTLSGPAHAMDDVALKAAMASFGEAAQAQRLENEIAGYVKSGDLEKLTQLAEDIQAKDGEFLNILTLIVEQQEQDVSEELALMAPNPPSEMMSSWLMARSSIMSLLKPSIAVSVSRDCRSVCRRSAHYV